MTAEPLTAETPTFDTHVSSSHATDPLDQVDPQGPDETLSAPVLAALERTWAAIRRQHPDLPAVVVVLAAGSIGTPRGTLKLGHFAAMRWDHDTTTPTPATASATALTGEAMAEVFVGGEGLARGPVDVLGTLLHEAAHALAHVRSLQDTSRQGRYHNRRYAALAVEVGLDVAEIGDIGWPHTTPTSATCATYGEQIDALRSALTIHRRAEGAIPTGGTPDPDGKRGPGTTRGAGGRASSNNGRACQCSCGRRIRVAPAVLALGPITCGLCGQPFNPTTPAPATGEPASAAPGARARPRTEGDPDDH